MTSPIQFEERDYRAAVNRALLITSPLIVLGFGGVGWLGYLYYVDGAAPWYLWVASLGTLIVAAVLKNGLVEKAPCPQCGAKPLPSSYVNAELQLICARCRVRWNTHDRTRDA
jgi:hypothetical protein